MPSIISLGEDVCLLRNVADGVLPSDAVNVSQLSTMMSPQWGIFHCTEDYRTVTGSGAIENLQSIHDSPINQGNVKTAKKHNIAVNTAGIYQVNFRAMFTAETSAAGILQIKSGSNIVGEGHPFTLAAGETTSAEMSQLVFLSPTEYLSVCVNITSIKGRFTYVPGPNTMVSLFLVAKTEAP